MSPAVFGVPTLSVPLPELGFFVSPAGGTGAGTKSDPWSWAYAIGSGAGSAQGDGKLHTGDTVWVRGGTYPMSSALAKAAGVVGSGVDNEDGKIIYRAYNPRVAVIPRSLWMSGNAATWLGTGDPRQTEHPIFEQDCVSAAPTAGAVTVSGAQTGTSLTVAKAAGVNQPIAVGVQLNIASGPAAGLYVIQSATTILQNTTTVLSVLPALRSTGTAGGESISLVLQPAANVDTLTCDDNASFLWFWDLHIRQIHYLRTVDFSGAGFSTYQKTNDGIKVINTSFEGIGGSPMFIERTSGRIELNGNLAWNSGHAPPGTPDGGGHGNYVHHNDDGVKEMLLEAQCFYNDHGIAIQVYDTTQPAIIGRIRIKNNVSMNSGQLNIDSSLGRQNATTWTIGGSQGGSTIFQNIIGDGNVALQTDGNGDRAFDCQPSGSAKIGANCQIINNYSRTSGGGYGCLRMGSVVAATGSWTHTGNTYRCYRPQTGPPQINGVVLVLQESGATTKPGQYVWGGNTYWRNATADNPACGDEAGVPKAFQTPGASCANQTLANFSTICAFPTGGQASDTVGNDPATTQTGVLKRRFAAGSAWAWYDNYAGLSSIPIDLSSFLSVGQTYIVHDVRDIYGAPIMGTPSVYAGGTVNFPNTQLSDPAQSGGHPGLSLEAAAPATAPAFNVFLVRRVA